MRLWFLGGFLGGVFAKSIASANYSHFYSGQQQHQQQQQEQQQQSCFFGWGTAPTSFCAPSDQAAAAVIADASLGKAHQQQVKESQKSLRCVIVGGGYAGCELAYKLDSVFDVTLIDEKNFLENRMEMVRVLCSPWTEDKTPLAAGSEAAASPSPSSSSSRRLAQAAHFVHRVYLKRANIVTGTVEQVQFDPPRGGGGAGKKHIVEETRQKAALLLNRDSSSSSSNLTALSANSNSKFVRLKDGRKVPFDLIIFATGEQLSFPFSTSQQTSDQRLAEVKHFCEFMQQCHRVAVVGGGGLGCSVAGYLAAGRPDMMIDLYNKHSTLLPSLPRNMQSFAQQALEQFPNVKIHSCSTVEDVSPRVVSLENTSNNQSNATKSASPSLEQALDMMKQSEQQAAQQDQDRQQKTGFDISFDIKVRKFSSPPTVSHPSIFVRCWMGNDFHGEMPLLPEHLPIKASSVNKKKKEKKAEQGEEEGALSSSAAQVEKEEEVVIVEENLTPAAALARKRRELEEERKASSVVETVKGYDYVFVCTGGAPRMDLFHNSPELRGHLDGKGHIRISKFFQLYGYPEAWAVGRCTSLPFTRSVGQSHLASNTLFRALMARFSENAGQTANTQLTSKLALDAHCIMPQRMAVPRIVVPLGPNQTTACGAWYGPVGGDTAQKERKVEEQMFREFRHPKFFKVQDPRKVRQSFQKWLETATTPVQDFSF